MPSYAKRNCTINKLNVRVEMHGDEEVPCCDVNVSGIPFDRDELDELCGKYTSRSLFDTKGKTVETALKMFDSPFPLTPKWAKSRVTLYVGLNEEAIKLSDVKLCKAQVDPQVGGMSFVSLQIQARPDGEQMAQLYEWQGKDGQGITLWFGTVEEKPKDKQRGLDLGEAGEGEDDDHVPGPLDNGGEARAN